MNWRGIRKADISTRRQMLRQFLESELNTASGESGDIATRKAAVQTGFLISGPNQDHFDIAELLVENAIGTFPVPLGLAGGFLIDGIERVLPMATEEPSVIAAASFTAAIIAKNGGFTTWADEPVMQSYLYIDDARRESERVVAEQKKNLIEVLAPILAPMESRGGGIRGIDAGFIKLRDGSECLRVRLSVDVRDAMGANILNSCAEALRTPLEKMTGGTVLIAILSNEASERKAGASFSIVTGELARGGFSGIDAAHRIARAALLADSDSSRAVTHNKGIMNGISALALATANDTRAIEASVHAWAANKGSYRSLSQFTVEGDYLRGKIEVPLAFGTVGGAASFHPVAALSLEILGQPSGQELSRYAAALGLAQNFAALWALTTEGIQKGHMLLHAKRLAFAAGARGDDVGRIAQKIAESGKFNLETARKFSGGIL